MKAAEKVALTNDTHTIILKVAATAASAAPVAPAVTVTVVIPFSLYYYFPYTLYIYVYQRHTSHIVVDDGKKVNLILTLLWHKSKWNILKMENGKKVQQHV